DSSEAVSTAIRSSRCPSITHWEHLCFIHQQLSRVARQQHRANEPSGPALAIALIPHGSPDSMYTWNLIYRIYALAPSQIPGTALRRASLQVGTLALASLPRRQSAVADGVRRAGTPRLRWSGLHVLEAEVFRPAVTMASPGLRPLGQPSPVNIFLASNNNSQKRAVLFLMLALLPVPRPHSGVGIRLSSSLVLLEDERVYVAVECDPACELPPAHQHQLASQLFVHPKLGAGSNHRLLQVSVNTTVVQLLTRLTTTSDLATNSSHRRLSSVTSDKDYYGVGGVVVVYGKYSAGAGKSSSSAGGGYAYESTKFGLQLIEQISSVAASADAEDLLATRPVASPLDTFASVGGLSLLAQLLPALYPGLSRLSAPCSDPAVAASTAAAGGAKLLATGGPSAGSANAYSYAFADEGSESYSTSGDDMEMYESNSAAAAAAAAAATAAFAVSDFDVPPSVGGGAGVVGSAGGGVALEAPTSYWMSYGPSGGGGVKKSSSGGGLGGHHSAGGRGGLAAGSSSHVLPTYSLIAFGLFLRLPGYDAILLARRREAQCLLRLALGVSDDPDGVSLLAGRYSTPLPILPFRVLQRLYQQQQTSSDDELRLRQESVKLGILDLCLSCLSVLSHHPSQAPQQQQRSNHPDIVQAAVETLQFQLNAQPNSHHPQQQQQGAGGSVGIPPSTGHTVWFVGNRFCWWWCKLRREKSTTGPRVPALARVAPRVRGTPSRL
uniref:RING-type domain-containing protein n=1 Tax=Macrostomum lignano TaxID=282301 RepID=A0A1I8FCG7_9PLAT